MTVVTYKEAKRIKSTHNGKVRCGREPDLNVKHATANLGPLEFLFSLACNARIGKSVSLFTVGDIPYGDTIT